MYTSLIKKLLFGSDKNRYVRHFPHMVIPLLGPDTDLPALAQVLAQDDKCSRNGIVAAVITWIIANRPTELTAFCQAYGQPSTVYYAIRADRLPETVSKHFRIHELVHEAINPDAKLCKDPRVGSLGLRKDMLLKAPVSHPDSIGGYRWYYEYESEDAAIASLKEYLQGKHFEVFFVPTAPSYNEWIEHHYNIVYLDGCNRDGSQRQRRTRKAIPPSRKGVILADIDIRPRLATGIDKDGFPSPWADRHLKITAGDEPNEWVAKLYASSASAPTRNRLVEKIGSFTAAKIVSPTNYKQIIAEVTKLPAMQILDREGQPIDFTSFDEYHAVKNTQEVKA